MISSRSLTRALASAGLALLLCLVAVSPLAPIVQAHNAAGEAVTFVDGQDALSNPFASISTFTPQDLAPKSYPVKAPIKFTVDEDAFGAGSVFRWRWEGLADDIELGPESTKFYPTPGSHYVILQVKPAGGQDFADANTIGVDIIPTPTYVLPKAKIKVTSRSVSAGTEVTLQAVTTQDTNATIAYYDWQLGDGSVDHGQTIKHTYKGKDVSVKPYLKITDSNHLTSETAINLTVASGHLSTANLSGAPDGLELSASSLPGWVPPVAVSAIIVVAILIIMFIRRKPRRPDFPTDLPPTGVSGLR